MLMQISKAKKGLTLIELLIVIAIIGLLATLAIVSLTTAQQKARDTKRVADIKQLQNAVELFYSETTAYPLTTAAVNETWVEFGTAIEDYITNVPIDPDNDDAALSVYTYGANTAGTEYFIGALLEDTYHDALNGDDDTDYDDTVTAGWDLGVDFVESDDVAANEVVTNFNCADDVYCV